MQFNINLTVAIIICLGVTGYAQNEKRSHPIDETSYQKYANPTWANHSIWDDGLAEVAVYDATRRVYGKIRDYECTYITVKEVFNEAYQVKTDDYDRDDLYDVLKVNRFERIEMEKYPYHFLTSMFFKRNAPQKIYKMTISNQEWCGNTFKAYTPLADGYKITYNSYWDGEGTGEKIKEGNFLFEDQLSFTLRTMQLENGLTFNARVMPSQISAKVGPIYADVAVFRVGSISYTFQEKEIEAWRVAVQLDLERANLYIIEKAYPNRLLKVQTWDQRNLTLKDIKRYAYW